MTGKFGRLFITVGECFQRAMVPCEIDGDFFLPYSLSTKSNWNLLCSIPLGLHGPLPDSSPVLVSADSTCCEYARFRRSAGWVLRARLGLFRLRRAELHLRAKRTKTARRSGRAKSRGGLRS